PAALPISLGKLLARVGGEGLEPPGGEIGDAGAALVDPGTFDAYWCHRDRPRGPRRCALAAGDPRQHEHGSRGRKFACTRHDGSFPRVVPTKARLQGPRLAASGQCRLSYENVPELPRV